MEPVEVVVVLRSAESSQSDDWRLARARAIGIEAQIDFRLSPGRAGPPPTPELALIR